MLWAQGLGLTAEMLILMLLLERFYGVLRASLDAERQATAARAAANRALEGEMARRQRLERGIARATDEERRGVGRDIHDGVCQQLTGALLRCQALELRLERGTPPTQPEIGALSGLLAETIHEARAVAEGLSPLNATPSALAGALRELARRAERTSGVPCTSHVTGDVRVEGPVAARHLYRIAQEAVGNAIRHAGAKRITISLKGDETNLWLAVEDDGVGMPTTVRVGALGLETMTHRAQTLEGELGIQAVPDGGTRVTCRVPRTACVLPDDTETDGTAGGSS
jgi:signal transduction histidine kinase